MLNYPSVITYFTIFYFLLNCIKEQVFHMSKEATIWRKEGGWDNYPNLKYLAWFFRRPHAAPFASTCDPN